MKKIDLPEVSRNFDLGNVEESRPLEDGLVNQSFFVQTEKGRFVLQILHSLWDERVINDYQSVQRYLRTHDLFVPVLLSTREGRPCFRENGNLWRAYEYIEHDENPQISPEVAFEAGKTLGKFHRLMRTASFNPTFSLPGFHDTPRIIEKLETIARDGKYAEKFSEARGEYAFIIRNIPQLYLPPGLQKTIIHGDPKLANFLFKNSKVAALLDFDTMMPASELVDLGDALRSWCRVKPSTPNFMPEIFDSAMRGYRTAYEIPYSDSEVKRAMGLITLELAARYLIDYFEESYFAYNAKKYASRALQNLTRTRRYLDYARNFLSELT